MMIATAHQKWAVSLKPTPVGFVVYVQFYDDLLFNLIFLLLLPSQIGVDFLLL
jgi:hypothetical protein